MGVKRQPQKNPKMGDPVKLWWKIIRIVYNGKKYLDEYYCPTSIYQVKLYSSQQANLTHFGTVYITPKCDT